MNCYEHTFITKQDLSDGQAKKLLNKYEELIKANSGKIVKIEEWGLRSLSHRIKNNRKGFYFHLKFDIFAIKAKFGKHVFEKYLFTIYLPLSLNSYIFLIISLKLETLVLLKR